MTHLTPGAKALYLKDKGDGIFERIVVTIHEVTKSHVVYYDETGAAHQRNTTMPDFCFRPLLSAVITDEGKAKERNEVGDLHPGFDHEKLTKGTANEENYRRWKVAEASLRTWEVEDTKVHHGDAWVMASFLPPGTPVLGYESPSGKFVIVEIVK